MYPRHQIGREVALCHSLSPIRIESHVDAHIMYWSRQLRLTNYATLDSCLTKTYIVCWTSNIDPILTKSSWCSNYRVSSGGRTLRYVREHMAWSRPCFKHLHMIATKQCNAGWFLTSALGSDMISMYFIDLGGSDTMSTCTQKAMFYIFNLISMLNLRCRCWLIP